MGRTSWKITLVLIAVAAVIFIKYNTMQNMHDSYTNQWENLDTQCQQRAILIPKLVRTAKASAIQEEEIFEQLANTKAIAANTIIDPTNLTADNVRKFQVAQDNLNSALIDLLDLAMHHPDLQENQDFLDLAAKLDGEENRIEVQKRRFNEQVKLFNTYIAKFPANLVANMIGFEKQASFSSITGANNGSELQ